MSEVQGKLYQVKYRDKASVFNCYMIFAKDGGMFVPCSRDAQMGEHIMLLVNLPESSQSYLLESRICWISHGRRKGFGVRFSGDEGSRALKVAIENLLGGSLKSTNPTYTM